MQGKSPLRLKILQGKGPLRLSTAKGKRAPFNQKEGSKGDPRKATFVKILTSCIAEDPFVTGVKASANIDLLWSPTEDEASCMIDRVCSCFNYWEDGCRKKSMVDWKGSVKWNGFAEDGKPSAGESWQNFYWGND